MADPGDPDQCCLPDISGAGVGAVDHPPASRSAKLQLMTLTVITN
jgi:hypothetical protein